MQKTYEETLTFRKLNLQVGRRLPGSDFNLCLVASRMLIQVTLKFELQKTVVSTRAFE